MDNNLDTPDFGIENTMEISGTGDTSLLNDLIAPETSTNHPDDVTPNKEDIEKADEVKKDVAKDIKGEEGNDIPDDVAKKPDSLTDFLLGNEEEEEEEEEDTATSPPSPEKQEDVSEGKEEKGEEGEESSEIAFDALAEELLSLGVFSKQNDEEKISVSTPEEFLERFQQEKQKGAIEMINNFIGQFGEEYRDAFDAIYVKGVEPSTYFTTQAKIDSFKSLDLSLESNQEKVIRQTLLNQEFENEYIDKEIEKLKNYGDLEDVSKRYHKVLVKKENKMLKQKADEAQQAQQVKLARKQEYVDNVRNVLSEKIKEKEFDGIPLNLQTANELQDFLLVDKWKTESGETLTDFDKSILELKRPENHATKVKVALLLKLLESDPTLSTIQKSGVSKKSSALFKDVARHTTKAKRDAGNKKQAPRSWFK